MSNPKLNTLFVLSLAACAVAPLDAGATAPQTYTSVALGAGAGTTERLAHCACVTAAGRPDMCVPADAWEPQVTEQGVSHRVYASGALYTSTDPALTVLYAACGGQLGFFVSPSAPGTQTVAAILASGHCDYEKFVASPQAAAACAYVLGRLPAPLPPRGAFDEGLTARRPRQQRP